MTSLVHGYYDGRTFLNAQRVDRSVSGVDKAVFTASLPDCLVDLLS